MSKEPDLLRLAEATPLTAVGDIISLDTFSREEVIKMVSGILKDQMVLTKEALDRLYALTAGHPFFVSLFHLIERYQLEKGAAVQVTQDMLD